MTEKHVSSLVNRIANARKNIEREARRMDLMIDDLRALEPQSDRSKNAAAGSSAIIAALELLPS